MLSGRKASKVKKVEEQHFFNTNDHHLVFFITKMHQKQDLKACRKYRLSPRLFTKVDPHLTGPMSWTGLFAGRFSSSREGDMDAQESCFFLKKRRLQQVGKKQVLAISLCPLSEFKPRFLVIDISSQERRAWEQKIAIASVHLISQKPSSPQP